MKIFLKVVLVLFILYVCAVAGEFFAGVLGAIGAVYFHASPYATTVIVRVLATVFFFFFVLVAWVIYSRRRARGSRQDTSVTTR
jgi:hypothetical protein